VISASSIPRSCWRYPTVTFGFFVATTHCWRRTLVSSSIPWLRPRRAACSPQRSLHRTRFGSRSKIYELSFIYIYAFYLINYLFLRNSHSGISSTSLMRPCLSLSTATPRDVLGDGGWIAKMIALRGVRLSRLLSILSDAGVGWATVDHTETAPASESSINASITYNGAYLWQRPGHIAKYSN
jgi:hypothetical protein